MEYRQSDARALINEVEGHLLIEAACREGRAASARCASRLHWLADGQRKELEQEFVDVYLDLCRLSWQRTASRARELRAEYNGTYRRLRRRLITGFALGVALVGVSVLLVVGGVWSGDSHLTGTSLSLLVR
jgi:hypothetical protein